MQSVLNSNADASNISLHKLRRKPFVQSHRLAAFNYAKYAREYLRISYAVIYATKGKQVKMDDYFPAGSIE